MKFKLLVLAALIGCVSMNTGAAISSEFDGGVGWLNYTNDATATAGGFSYGIADLISITSDNLTFEMYPNTALYAGAVANVTTNGPSERVLWTDSIDGGVTPGNLGGSEVDALTYRSGSPLVGTTNLVFNLNVDANSLDTNYEARAFIKVLEPFGSWNILAYTNVVLTNTGPYTLNKEVIPGDEAYVFQAGLQLIGLNANATNAAYAGYGSITATIDDILFQDDDFIVPSPDPMTWASVPSALSSIAIEMTATTAVDTNGVTDVVDNGVQYLFTNVTAATTSGWQSSPYWLDEGAATPATTNIQNVISNTTFSPVNTGWNGYDSGIAGAVNPTNFVTSAAGVATITPINSPGGNVEVNYYAEFNGTLEGATTWSVDAANITSDGSPTIFVKEFDSGWGWIGWSSAPLAVGSNSVAFVATAGNIYQAGVLTTSSTGGSYDISNPAVTTPVVTPGTPGGLTPSTLYSYQVKARDLSSQLNETGWSTPVASATTFAGETNAPTPSPMTFADIGDASPVSILLNASVATDGETSVQYLFSNTVNNVTSGWQAGTQYLETGLTPGSNYTYTVTARDLNGNKTDPSTPLVVATLSEPTSGSFSDSLTGYSGTTDDPIVAHNLAKLGLETGSTNPDAVITFTSTGAVFSAGVGFTGRDVLRTVAAAYDVNFTAYATITISSTQTDQSGYIGIGQGLITGTSGDNWGVPELALAGVNGVVGELKTATAGGDKVCKVMKTVDGDPGIASGGETLTSPVVTAGETVRIQLIHNADSNTVRIAINNFYTPGDPFVESQLLGEVSTIVSTTGTNMWVNAPVRVYFGGGEGTRVQDIEVAVDTVAPPVPVADLVILSAGGGVSVLQWTGVSGQAYSVEYKNDLTAGSWTPDAANQDISGVNGLMATPSTVAGDNVFFQVSTDHE